MPMRGLASLLAGALIAAATPAIGASAPMDTVASEPAEDLFAPKPADLPPAAPVPGPAAPAATADKPAPQGGYDNPLWAVPLSRLTATRERPLFAPSRRPPAVPPVAMPAPPPGPPPRPPEPETPRLSLVGTIIGAERIGLFVDSASKSVVRLKPGENHEGWTLRAVERRRVEMARGLDQAVLDLPVPDMKSGGAPPAPMPASPPPIPSAPPGPMAAAPPPTGANGGAYVHPGANMNLPIGRGTPANLRLPPGLVSPLSNPGPR